MSENILNPDIRKVMVGNRTMREIQIFPLSTKDEMDLGEIIAQAISDFAAKAQDFDGLAGDTPIANSLDKVGVVGDSIRLLVTNIQKVLAIVSDIPKEEIETVALSMTNPQIMEIATIIWENNYEAVQKNVQNLLGKVRGKAAPSA